MKDLLRQDAELVEQRLNSMFSDDVLQKRLLEAMRYSLLAGGKRIRPVLTLEFCRACGGDPETALDFACAVEMIHTYSLIHDDLPCMDNDDLRRGRPTNHKVYGEWLAVLAGDALQAAAFELIAAGGLPAGQRAKAAAVLAHAAGAYGMCGGQLLDMDGEGREFGELEISRLQALKTGAIISAAAQLGCIAAGAGEEKLSAARSYAGALGLAFQIKDDLLDLTGAAEEMGKTPGKDQKSHKATFAALFGIERCERLLREKTEEAKSALSVFEDAAFLSWLADYLAERNH